MEPPHASILKAPPAGAPSGTSTTLSFRRVGRLWNSRGPLRAKNERLTGAERVGVFALRLALVCLLPLVWVLGAVVAPAVSIGLLPWGGLPLAGDSPLLLDLLPLSAWRHPQAAGFVVQILSWPAFCCLAVNVLHPRLAVSAVVLFIAGTAVQMLYVLSHLSRARAGMAALSFAALAIGWLLALLAMGATTPHLRAVYASMWNPRMPEALQDSAKLRWATLVVGWGAAAVAGVLGPAMLTGSPAVSFDKSPAEGLALTLLALLTEAALAAVLLSTRAAVAVSFGFVGAVGGLLLLRLGGVMESIGGTAVLLLCGCAALTKGRKICFPDVMAGLNSEAQFAIEMEENGDEGDAVLDAVRSRLGAGNTVAQWRGDDASDGEADDQEDAIAAPERARVVRFGPDEVQDHG